jgi:hypothetical protein
METTLALADALGLLAHAGTIIAVASALLTGLAICRGLPNHAGVAAAGWLIGALLSLCATFAGNWLLPAIATAALPAALVATGAFFFARAALSPRSPIAHLPTPEHCPALRHPADEPDDAIESVAAMRAPDASRPSVTV